MVIIIIIITIIIIIIYNKENIYLFIKKIRWECKENEARNQMHVMAQ